MFGCLALIELSDVEIIWFSGSGAGGAVRCLVTSQ
jgi:hypothetical protein